MRILMIMDEMPYPVVSGAPLRSYNLLRRVADEHDVWLAAFATTPEQVESVAHFETFCRGVAAVPGETAEQGVFAKPGEFLRYLLRGVPPDLRLFVSEPMCAAVRELVAEVEFDAVQIEQSYMAHYLDVLPPALQQHAVLTLHDIVFIKYDRMFRLEPKLGRKLRQWLHSWMMRRWEPRYAARFARLLTMSEIDKRLLLDVDPSLKIEVVPNGFDTEAYKMLPYSEETPNLLYVGNMAYRPNIDAVLYFCDEVFPLVRREVPDVTFWIVGINPGTEVRDLANRVGVTVTGRVEDVRPYYAQSKVCVVPLRAGGGTRLKILESMALGRAVVSTTVGSEGIDAVDGEHLLIGDTPGAFAAHTVRLLTDPVLREHITQQARELVVSQYDWDVIAAKLLKILEEVV